MCAQKKNTLFTVPILLRDTPCLEVVHSQGQDIYHEMQYPYNAKEHIYEAKEDQMSQILTYGFIMCVDFTTGVTLIVTLFTNMYVKAKVKNKKK